MLSCLFRYIDNAALLRSAAAGIGLVWLSSVAVAQAPSAGQSSTELRQQVSINMGWSFYKYENAAKADNLIYDVRPEVSGDNDHKIADAKPTEAVEVAATQAVLKPWILPTGNRFIKDPAKRHVRPAGKPGADFPFVQAGFDDSAWDKVNLPHDWAIKGPFYTGADAAVGGSMARLPSPGVAWYRKKLTIPAADAGKSVFLDVDGAMSYAMVWINGQLAGGWPYGYTSWRIDLTPYLVPGGENQLAIRLDNPPAPELLQLTDRMGFLVVNEVFDVWERKKRPLDFHLIFPEWHEQDLRALIRRDRNNPSVIMWSFGNEVGEQYTGEEGAAVSKRLHRIVKEEDPHRPTTASMNYAKPDMPLPATMDVISLNYQGEGIRDAPAYTGLEGIKTAPLYPAFQSKFPDKVILSSENAAALSSRGEYLFPVTNEFSAPVKNGAGGNPNTQQVSAYELYTAPFGASADKVFASLERHPYVAGGFVWSGWDYLGEPTPYYGARSSYFGVIDLAGFKKDRFYLYQSHWRPDFPMVHILPHWNWPDRVGQVTPVHVFTSGDAVELFLNGKSLGKKQKDLHTYRLRWDDVKYEPGTLKAVAYKNGKKWSTTEVKTAGAAAKLELVSDRKTIHADGEDLAFITLKVLDENKVLAPDASNLIQFEIEGPGEIVATDNGDPTSFVPFGSKEREAFHGLALVVVRPKAGIAGQIKIVAKSPGLQDAQVIITSK